MLGIVLNKTSDGPAVRRGGFRSALARWATARHSARGATRATS
ncbi:hypothetical protein ACU4GR_26310 [Methylobacterium oryzae CBMB20]